MLCEPEELNVVQRLPLLAPLLVPNSIYGRRYETTTCLRTALAVSSGQ